MFDLDEVESRIEDLERKIEEQSATMEKKITDLNSKLLDRLESMEKLLLEKLEGLAKEKPVSLSGKADGTSLVAPQSTGKLQETREAPVSDGKQQPPVRRVQIVPDGPHGFVTVEDETLIEPFVDEPSRINHFPVHGSHGSGSGMAPEHNRRPLGYVGGTEEAWVPEFHRGPPMGPQFSHHYQQPRHETFPTGEAYGMVPLTTEWREYPNQRVSSAQLVTAQNSWERPPVNGGEQPVGQGTGRHGQTPLQPPPDRGIQGGFRPNNPEVQNSHAVSPCRFPFPEIDFPRFDGTDPEVWLFKCELFFEIFPMDESKKVKFAAFHMDGKAANWFRPYWRGECPLSWDQFHQGLCTRFAEIELESPVGKFFRLTQTSTVMDYIELHKELRPRVCAENPGLSETLFVDCFIAGLKDDVRFELLMRNPKALKDCYELALLKEKHLECLARIEQQDSDNE